MRDFAVIGCGHRADIAVHLSALRPDARVVAVADVSVEGRARGVALFGPDVRRYPDTATLLAAERGLSGAFVTSPDHTHVSVGTELLRAGIPTYLEKPMALTAAAADELLDCADDTGTTLFVGHNMRYMAVVTAMKRLIDDGAVGRVHAVWCRHFVGHGGDFYFRDWHAERAHSHSLLLQKAVHDIDVIHHLAGGFTRRVQAFGTLAVYGDLPRRTVDPGPGTMSDWFDLEHYPPKTLRDLNPVIDVEDLAQVNMVLDNGVLATYAQCHFTPDYWRNYTVIGDEGRLENVGDGDGGRVQVWKRRSDHREDADLVVPIVGDKGGHGDADRLTVAAFLGVLDEPAAAVRVSARAAREAVATAATATASMRSEGRTLVVRARGEGS